MVHFLTPFMMSAVGIALPTIGGEFGATALQLGLIETTYVLSASIFLLAMGRLGDIYGRRRIFQWGVFVFTGAAALLWQAWSIETVILFRFIQGVGGAMVMATSMAIIATVFPPNERGKALGLAVASVYAGISCGPLVGGFLVSSFGWRAVFAVGVPLGCAVFLITARKLKGDWREAQGEPFDGVGSLIYAGSLILLIVGVSRLEQGGWAVGSAAAGVAGLLLFLRFEARHPYPILNVALLRDNPLFALSNLAALFNYAATFGLTFFLSLYLQTVKGLSPHHAGLLLVLQPVTQTLFSPACGRLADRYPAANVATAGMALCAAGLGIAATLSAETPLVAVAVVLLFLGAGFALFSSPNMSAILGSVAPRYLGIASGLAATMRTLGMMTSMTVITLLFSLIMKGEKLSTATHAPFLVCMRSALLFFCGLCAVGVILSMARLHPELTKTTK